MEIIEKQVEKTKEVPYGYWENCGYGGYGRNVNGKANAGLTLGIIGTVLGGAALLGRRNGFNLFGNSAGTSGSDAAIRPYQDKLIQCEIDKAFTAGINYTDRKTCKMIEGQVVLPNTPTVTGFGSYQCTVS